jgi:chromosome segregation ATPase
LKDIENKNNILQQQIDENSEYIQNKDNVIVTLTESSIENNDKMNNINHQLQAARETINVLKKRINGKENEINKLKENLNNYQLNEIQLNKTNEERMSLINKLKSQLDEEAKANEKLRLIIKDLNSKLKVSDDTIDQLKNENFILNSKIEVIPVKEKDDNEKNIFKANLEKRTNEYVELRKTNSVLRNNLKDEEEKLITLTKQVENYKREFTKINEKIKGTKNDNARTLKEKEEELSNLSEKNTNIIKIFKSKK